MFATFTVRRLAVAVAAASVAIAGASAPAMASGRHPAPATTTPIKHLVVIYQENVSFDHYFATYHTAVNPGR